MPPPTPNEGSHTMPPPSPNHLFPRFDGVVPSNSEQVCIPKPTLQPPRTSDKPTKETTYHQPAHLPAKQPTDNRTNNNQQQPTKQPTIQSTSHQTTNTKDLHNQDPQTEAQLARRDVRSTCIKMCSAKAVFRMYQPVNNPSIRNNMRARSQIYVSRSKENTGRPPAGRS